MADFLLEMYTPERLFFMEKADMVVLPSFDGELGVMAGHEKMVSVLISGIIKVKQGEQWRSAACAEGYAMIYGDQVIVLTQSLEWPEEIDESRAHDALGRAEHRLEDEHLSHRDRILSIAARSRARARLHLLSRFRGRDTKDE